MFREWRCRGIPVKAGTIDIPTVISGIARGGLESVVKGRALAWRSSFLCCLLLLLQFLWLLRSSQELCKNLGPNQQSMLSGRMQPRDWQTAYISYARPIWSMHEDLPGWAHDVFFQSQRHSR